MFSVSTITSNTDPNYASFRSLYQGSFPIFEQRTESEQLAAFSDSHYRLIVYREKETLAAFIDVWDFDSYIYIEHFAVNPLLRGQGLGTQLLKEFIENSQKIVLLEIDPLVDEVSRARLRFYERCGFYVNPFEHQHPPYRKEFDPHRLIVLTTQRTISKEEYLRFNDDLKSIVMKQCA